MTDINFRELAEIVLRSQHYPSHLLVGKSTKTLDTGVWVKVFDWDATLAMIECAMRSGVESGLSPMEAVQKAKPLTHVYAQGDELINSEQSIEIFNLINNTGVDSTQFLEYMKVESHNEIKAKDYKKALNAIETIKKAGK